MNNPRSLAKIARLGDGTTGCTVGAKATRLSQLRAGGFRVPDGVVIPVEVIGGGEAELISAVRDAVDMLGDRPLAVRSSAVAEDATDASFAGLYESVLDVTGFEDVLAAVRQVVASASAERVSRYAAGTDLRIAVLLQHLIRAEAAGVAFTANPITGARDEIHVSAVAGLGEQLVSGGAMGEDWVVTSAKAVGPRGASVLKPADASRIAELAAAVAEIEGVPQDIEWALAGGDLWLLQARPMTALPEEVSWELPGLKGWWRRDFRIGEWLPEPVTPLFETWFLPTHEAAFEHYCREQVGMATTAPFNVVVHGWCFAGIGGIDLRLATSMLRRPGFTLQSAIAAAKMFSDPAPLERIAARPSLERFRSDVLPRYRTRVQTAESEVENASPRRLVELVDDICRSFGELMLPVVETLGFAYKSELALGSFTNRHLSSTLEGGHMTLLGGLTEPSAAPPHSVVSLDWIHPTLGESQSEPAPPSDGCHAELDHRRREDEARCRAALADKAKLLGRFERLLALAQEYAPIRQEIADAMTIGWPVTRRALMRLGLLAVEHGTIARPDDIFFLTRDEMEASVIGDDRVVLDAAAAARRELRARQALLVPPERIGPKKSNHERGAKQLDRVRACEVGTAGPGAMVGQPSSPGVASGPVRVVTDVEQFDLVQPGDILVAQVTTPGWTPLFSIIAGVVTDGGSIAAHASIVAREYGIPAVVGTLDATKRLCDGEIVTVDGGRGIVTREGRR